MACKITKKGIKPCKGLSGVIQFPGGMGTRRQGVEIRTIINIKSGKFARHWAILKSGDHGKRGIIMNYCPFCAGKLLKEAEWSSICSPRGFCSTPCSLFGKCRPCLPACELVSL